MEHKSWDKNEDLLQIKEPLRKTEQTKFIPSEELWERSI